jgi:hypothetical protein
MKRETHIGAGTYIKAAAACLKKTTTSDVGGRSSGFSCQHLLIIFHTLSESPKYLASSGFFGLRPCEVMIITLVFGMSGNGTFPVKT